MEVKASAADKFIGQLPRSVVAALVYGPDQGLVRERAAAVARTVLADLKDPFRVAELEESALESDPARLWDEAAAFSMTGGRRVVRVRSANNGLAGTFEKFLSAPPGDALIVVEAGELAKSGALRRVFEGAANAAAIPCYLDDARALEELVRSQLKSRGLSIEEGALHFAVAHLGSDRGITRSELEKLALYAMGEPSVSEAHVAAIMGDESELRMDEALDAAGEGDFARLDRRLAQLWAAGIQPVAVLRQAMGHFQRLMALRAEADEGGNVSAAIKKLRPPVHFSRERSLQGQAGRWSMIQLETALDLLYEGEALTKTTAVPAEAACGRALLSVAALAGRGR
jgi:DNA polymerase III subunit delta